MENEGKAKNLTRQELAEIHRTCSEASRSISEVIEALVRVQEAQSAVTDLMDARIKLTRAQSKIRHPHFLSNVLEKDSS